MNRFVICLALGTLALQAAAAPSPDELFDQGTQAYRNGEFSRAAKMFGQSASERPAEGTFRNLGNANWECGRTGPAILAWERALWLSPSDDAARSSLRFARDTLQIAAPELTWYEDASTWIAGNLWAWVTAISLWVVVGFLTIPIALRKTRTAWHQAAVALGAAVFLFTIPAHIGLATRTRLGFILQPDTPLRLTPTRDAEDVTLLGAGEPARCLRTRGDYVYIQLNRASGWVLRDQVGLICPANPAVKNESKVATVQ